MPQILLRIRHCESHDDYLARNPASSASGAFQVIDSTWHRHAGFYRAYQAPRWVQDKQALMLYREQGTAPWLASKRCWR